MHDSKKVLTIAGSDCSGGAGIQADLKTICAHKLYGMSAITSLTAQNTTGVFGISDVTPEFLSQQLDAVFTDIFPDAVKIGMVSSPKLIEIIIDKLTEYKARNIVVDPVMVSTSGCKLISDDAIDILINGLMPLSDIITPNIPEACVISDIAVSSRDDIEKAAEAINNKLSEGSVSSNQTSILIKGGHSISTANDCLLSNGHFFWFNGERIDNNNTHGTGCTLSSAIACNLAMGFPVQESVANAKKYLTGALKDGLNLGNGDGPLNHTYWLDIKEK